MNADLGGLSALPSELPKINITKPLLLGIVMGLAVVLIGNVATFSSQGKSGFFFVTMAQTGPYLVIAGLLFALMIGLGLRDKPHVIGAAIGAPMMYFGEPYMAFMAESLWIDMYSVDHVDQMLIQSGLRAPPLL